MPYRSSGTLCRTSELPRMGQSGFRRGTSTQGDAEVLTAVQSSFRGLQRSLRDHPLTGVSELQEGLLQPF